MNLLTRNGKLPRQLQERLCQQFKASDATAPADRASVRAMQLMLMMLAELAGEEIARLREEIRTSPTTTNAREMADLRVAVLTVGKDMADIRRRADSLHDHYLKVSARDRPIMAVSGHATYLERLEAIECEVKALRAVVSSKDKQ